jgi:hypothetical protein
VRGEGSRADVSPPTGALAILCSACTRVKAYYQQQRTQCRMCGHVIKSAAETQPAPNHCVTSGLSSHPCKGSNPPI